MQPWRSFFKTPSFLPPFRMFFNTRQVGGPSNSLEYRLFLEDSSTGKVVSPFHDIPMWANESEGIVNMVIEIPRWSNAKLEICKEELMNPIKQDVKKGKLRFIKNIFPHHGYPWNYGAIPQTWECPDQLDQATGFKGDNDPVDAVEIGSALIDSGLVKQVKVIGAIALIDEGETDWKIMVVDIKDPLATVLNDIGDVDVHCPGLLDATRRWFRDYKVPDGKGKNAFAFNGEYRNRQFALSIIRETHEMWCQLIEGKIPNATNISLVSRKTITNEDESKIPSVTCTGSCPPDLSINDQVFVL